MHKLCECCVYDHTYKPSQKCVGCREDVNNDYKNFFSVNDAISEIERLNKRLLEQFELHLKVIGEYQEALRKCSPDTYIVDDESDEVYIICNFCKKSGRHDDDCEYIKLIGDGENEL